MKVPQSISYTGFVNVEFGMNVSIVQPVNMYDCFIGSDVFVGSFTEIQKLVRIGGGTKIQSHSFICEGVEIGEFCFIAHGIMFVNDLFKIGGPARGNKALWRNTIVGNNVSIGSNATILPVSICAHVVIGAGSVVSRNIDIPGVYAGNPARLLRKLN